MSFMQQKHNGVCGNLRSKVCAAPRQRRWSRRHARIASELVIFTSKDVQVDKFLGTMGYVSIFSNQTPMSTASVTSLQDLTRLSSQTTKESDFEARLFTGKVVEGPLAGTSVILKGYPPGRYRESDMLAANELSTHAVLQDPQLGGECRCLVQLLGGFLVTEGATTGEQWLVYRNDGTVTLDMYAQLAGRATVTGEAVAPGEVSGDFFDSLDATRTIRRRKKFVLRIMRQVLRGVAFMHSRRRAHGSIGPASVSLNTSNEFRVDKVQARLKDLAFAVDFSDEALWGGATLAELWEGKDYNGKQNYQKAIADALWSRGRQQGAWTEVDRRNFAMADDTYSCGLLLLFLCTAPMGPPGAVSLPDLQRLLEGTFEQDVGKLREYLVEDERFVFGVDFLDTGEGSGWDLLQAMLQKEWRRRPTADACLKHPFLTGASFSDNPPPPPGALAQAGGMDG